MCDTGSLVDQLHAEIDGDHLLHEDPELGQYGWSTPSWRRMLAICAVRDLAGQHVRGIAADPVEQDEHEQHDPDDGRDHLPHATDDVGGHQGSAGVRLDAEGGNPGRLERLGRLSRHAAVRFGIMGSCAGVAFV